MVIAKHRSTVATVDCDAIQHNIVRMKQHIRPGKQIYAVVKADGYGHGAVQVAKAAVAAGVDGFCVAVLDEALELREHGIDLPILVMGLIDEADAPLAAAHHIDVTVSDVAWLEAVSPQLQQPLHVHVKLDTGMSRIGLTAIADVQACDRVIAASQYLHLRGAMTHFATADGEDDAKVQLQWQLFHELLAGFAERPPLVHLSNTAISMWHEAFDTDIVRLGIGMYGVNPSDRYLIEPYQLEPVLSLTATLAYVKQVPAGTTIGYGATYTSETDEWIGTVQVGYADGWSRLYKEQPLIVDSQHCPVVGNICMDQLMIKLPKAYPVGTQVTLIGREGDVENDVSALARLVGTIGYEILCGITSRVPRHYIGGNRCD